MSERKRMPATEPDVTVIIPTFHREKQVLEAIRSALVGGADKLEVLVVDDSPEQSARASVSTIDDPRVSYLPMPSPSKGRPALVRNFALERSRGRYIYCLDDDDQCWPGSLGELAQALDHQPQAGVAFGQVKATGPDREVRAGYDRWWSWAARTARQYRFSSWLTVGIIMFRGTLVINSTCMMRRTAAVALGGYDPEIDVFEDVDFFTRGIRRFGHVYVDKPVLLYGTGQQSIMHDLDWERTVLARSHRRIHDAYKRTWGLANYRALQVAAKLLPIEPPPAQASCRSTIASEPTPPMPNVTWLIQGPPPASAVPAPEAAAAAIASLEVAGK
jgi:hypothetical protein